MLLRNVICPLRGVIYALRRVVAVFINYPTTFCPRQNISLFRKKKSHSAKAEFHITQSVIYHCFSAPAEKQNRAR
jgi:hypothetical protein